MKECKYTCYDENWEISDVNRKIKDEVIISEPIVQSKVVRDNN